jgi:uncharacterized membrane protein YidH (DUF202 family)
MPFTPFHFGPALFAKCVAPVRLSWLAFVAAQVVIDCETLFFLVQGAYPVHRFFHTLVGAALAGLGTGIVFAGLARRLDPRSLMPTGWEDLAGPSVRSEISPGAVMAGAVIGALSHPILDGIMHPDVRPFAPWSDSNPLLRVVGLDVLHVGCVALGVVGLVVMVARLRRERA